MAKRTAQDRILEPVEHLTAQIADFVRAAKKTYVAGKWDKIERQAALTSQCLLEEFEGEAGAVAVMFLLGAGAILHQISKEMRKESPEGFAATLEMAQAHHRVEKRAAGEEPVDDYEGESEDEEEEA